MALTALFGLAKNPSIPPAVTPQQVRPDAPAPGSEEITRRAREKAQTEQEELKRRRRGRSSTLLTGASGQLVGEQNVSRPTLGGR